MMLLNETSKNLCLIFSMWMQSTVTSRCRSMLYLWKNNLKKISKSINYLKVRDHCHYTGKYRDAAHSICNLKSNVPNEISVVFHNGSNYDYHFIINELAKFEGISECLGENKEKYKTLFSVPTERSYRNQ